MGFDNGFAVVAFTFTAVAAWGLAAPRILGRRSKFKIDDGSHGSQNSGSPDTDRQAPLGPESDFSEMLSKPFTGRKLRRRSALHDVDTALQERARAAVPRPVVKQFAPDSGYVVRIALTGGPCAGKSSALEHLRKAATSRGFDVMTAPETATVIFNTGYQFPTADADNVEAQRAEFQATVARLQLQMERNLLSLAALTGRPTIMVFDRGVLDGKGYMEAKEWAQLLEKLTDSKGNPVTEEYLLNRYDGVIHLVTAADGAEAFYKCGEVLDDSGHKVIRRETAEEARKLDLLMQHCWKDHPRHHIVRNRSSDFKQKLEQATNAVLQIAEDTHPTDPAAISSKGAAHLHRTYSTAS